MNRMIEIQPKTCSMFQQAKDYRWILMMDLQLLIAQDYSNQT